MTTPTNKAMKAAGAILAIAIPAVFNYLSARADSAEAKVRAEVAYETLQPSIKELQEIVNKQGLQIAELKGRIKANEQFRKDLTVPAPVPVVGRPTPKPVSKAKTDADADGIPDVVDVQQKMVLPPPDFHDAYDSYKAKK